MKIKALKIEPKKNPVVVEMENTLEELQRAVDGYIEAVYPFEDPVAIIANEEGKLNGLPLNRALKDDDGKVYDIIAGTFVLAGCGEDGDFVSLTDEQLNRYEKRFHDAETFIWLGHTIIAIPTTEGERI